MDVGYPTYSPTTPPFAFQLKDWLLYAYVLASPFYMFAVVSNRDWPALWIVGLMLLLFVVQFFLGGLRFWLDRSMYALLMFLAAYIVGALVIEFSDFSMTLLGRTPQERVLTTLTRLLYVVMVYGLFINLLADADGKTFKRIFAFQIVVGSVIALFGIIQYVSASVFAWGGLISIEPTNETFKMGSSFFGIGRTRVYRSAAIFQEPSAFGFFLVPLFIKALLAFLQNVIIGTKRIHLTLLVILVGGILVNLSLTALFSTVILMVVLFWTTVGGSRYFVSISAIALLGLGLILLTPVGGLLIGRVDRVFAFNDVSTLDRLFRAYVAIRIILDAPLFGVGPGIYAFLYPLYGGFERSGLATPLNVWLTFLTDVGILGFIPFVYFLINVLGRAKRSVGRHPLVRVYLWSVVSYLLLLTTVDKWFLEMFWFDVAMLVVLSSGPFLIGRAEHSESKVAIA